MLPIVIDEKPDEIITLNCYDGDDAEGRVVNCSVSCRGGANFRRLMGALSHHEGENQAHMVRQAIEDLYKAELDAIRIGSDISFRDALDILAERTGRVKGDLVRRALDVRYGPQMAKLQRALAAGKQMRVVRQED